MNITALFIKRPVATTLLALALLLSGSLAYFRLPVGPLPNIAFPVIVVIANMAGASPQTMASTVAQPLERRLATISDITEMTSMNSTGMSIVVIMFGLNRDINGAARDVQAAIQASRVDLPASLRANPIYREYNPATMPIMVLALSSPTLTSAQLYDSANSLLQQQLSQIEGVGQVEVFGGSLPAVRVELEPGKLNSYGIGFEDVRAALASANASSAKGHIDQGDERFEVTSNDQITQAAPYRDLVIAYRSGSPVLLSDLAQVIDSTENSRNTGMYNGQSAVLLLVHPSPDSNIVETVSRINARLPIIEAALPSSIKVNVAVDRSQSVQASVHETEQTLFIAVLLVVGVVYAFLLSARATIIPAAALALSIIGSLGPMYLLGFSIDNLSLMALTIGTGFVVDDAVVVLENISRHIEAGVAPLQAALRGAQEVTFTVISMSVSLIAVFLPFLLVPGIMGLFFHEFTMTLSIAIVISLVVSLTITPTMCAYLLAPIAAKRAPLRAGALFMGLFERFKRFYSHSLDTALDYPGLVMAALVGLLVGSLGLVKFLPSTLMPEQDTGILIGQIMADQSISFPAMKSKLSLLQAIVGEDPAVQAVAGFAGGRSMDQATVFIELKPLAERRVSAQEVVNRLRPRLSAVSGARLFLQAQQDLGGGARQAAAEYQYTFTSEEPDELAKWVPRLVDELGKYHEQLLDVNSDLAQHGLQALLTYDRSSASRLGLAANQIDNTLYDAYGQRTVSTIYNNHNQYFVIMEAAPKYTQYPQSLDQIWLSSSAGNVTGSALTQMPMHTVSGVNARSALSVGSAGSSGSSSAQGAGSATSANNAAANQLTNSIANSKGAASSGSALTTSAQTMTPLLSLASWRPAHTATQVNHQSGLAAATISFNLPKGGTMSKAIEAIDKAKLAIGMPAIVHGESAGVAQIFAQSLAAVPLLLVTALVVVYIVLGILYENTIHPLTILSTLPSAFIGAILAMLLFGTPISLIALIGIFLLIGIVKKNGIIMVDVAIDLQRNAGMPAREAIHEAALIRLRPILMTTAAAVLGALPLVIAIGQGASLRQPLGVTVVGGLLFSQIFTLYTTPVIYLMFERMRGWRSRRARRKRGPFHHLGASIKSAA